MSDLLGVKVWLVIITSETDNTMYRLAEDVACFEQQETETANKEGIELSVFVGIAELELLFGQLKVQIQHIVSPGDTVGYLHGKDGLAHIGIRKEAGQFPLIPEAVPHSTSEQPPAIQDGSIPILPNDSTRGPAIFPDKILKSIL